MTVKYSSHSLEPDMYQDVIFELNEISQCPRCKSFISPIFLFSAFKRYRIDSASLAKIGCFLFCPKCEHVFIGTYASLYKLGKYEMASLKSVEPTPPSAQSFDDKIRNLSPRFVEIYNQSLAAESYKLHEICGLGYRKSLEFLVKDFSIHFNPCDADKIRAMSLSSCVHQYLNDPSVNSLVEKAMWLGNDEAHYVRKHTDRDTNDLKTFITAATHFITLRLTIEDANSIVSQK